MATPTLSEFRNEPYADFSVPANRQAMEAALAKVRSEFGREYELRIGGEWIATGDKLMSVNPSNPQRSGRDPSQGHGGAGESRDRGAHTLTSASGAARPPKSASRMLLDAARILRTRKLEFDAWLVYEAGKTWPEAEADVSEAIDFCEYYAREMQRLGRPAAGGATAGRAGRDASTCRWASAW